MRKFSFPLSLAEACRFGAGMTVQRACLGKSATAPVAFVPMKGIDKNQFATVMFIFDVLHRPQSRGGDMRNRQFGV
jgi:hypothetical protein